MADKNSTKWNQALDLVIRGMPYAVIPIVGIAGVGLLILLYLGFRGETVKLLAELSYARGLITFIFAVGTVGIAVILTIAVIMGNEPDAGKRFERAKEILVILIGVFGTIVGFYFGTADSNSPPQPLEITTPLLPEIAPENEEIEIIAYISTGSPPFAYQIRFDSKELSPIAKQDVNERWIRSKLRLPEVDSTVAVRVTIEAEDEEGLKGEIGGSFTIQNRP